MVPLYILLAVLSQSCPAGVAEPRSYSQHNFYGCLADSRGVRIPYRGYDLLQIRVCDGVCVGQVFVVVL